MGTHHRGWTGIGALGVAMIAATFALGAAAEGGDVAEVGSEERPVENAVPPDIAEGLGLAPHADEAPVEAAAPETPPGPPVSRIEEVWRTPADDFATRVLHTRKVAVGLGAWSFDPAARALAADTRGAPEIERAEAAVALAPDLPAAHMWRAEQLWLRGGEPMAALRAVVDAMAAATRHLEASFWFGGSGLYLLAVAGLFGGLLAIALAGIAGLPHAAHDLGHFVSRAAPGFAGAAGLAALLGVPLALGEGLLGLALGLFAVAVVYGGRAQRFAMLFAALGVGFGAYPVARLAGAALAAFDEDPIARAAYSVSHGVVTPVDLARLERAAEYDALAARGLAIHARRTGRLGAADALYQRLLDDGARDVGTLNNAANVRLDLGHVESALELYTGAAQVEDPVVLFNLAQAYGRGFQVEDLNRTLERAQHLDGERVADLTALQGTDTRGFVVDYPLQRELFWRRVWETPGGASVASGLRAHVAPGRLGRDAAPLAGVGALLLLAGTLLGTRARPSSGCARCGDRVCVRCDPQARSVGDLCEGCHRLFHQPEKTDRLLRVQRVNEVRAREIRVMRWHALLSLLVPGAAGIVAKRPLSAWLGATAFVLAVAAWVWRAGVVPDPLVAGGAAPVAFVGVASLAALLYLTLVATSWAAARGE